MQVAVRRDCVQLMTTVGNAPKPSQNTSIDLRVKRRQLFRLHRLSVDYLCTWISVQVPCAFQKTENAFDWRSLMTQYGHWGAGLMQWWTLGLIVIPWDELACRCGFHVGHHLSFRKHHAFLGGCQFHPGPHRNSTINFSWRVCRTQVGAVSLDLNCLEVLCLQRTVW